MWDFFRRLLLGTVVEVLLENGVAVDFSSISIDFHDTSAFKVPRFDNYMRFHGQLTATIAGEMNDGTRRKVEQGLRTTWPELLKVVDIPVGDRLTQEKNQVRVDVVGQRLTVHFDLEAD
ncbi:MAG: hypothetical protein GY913_06845 [Proteobacteria bacterium]|nr:hypothetical protein [Pseudomonadota bacterium]MCP4916624.1 hypothetical protein [Pseudomonadota bacterium]